MIVAGTVQNVIARLAGTAGNQAILLVCHYDSVTTALGASDDGSGVATLLETARALKAGSPIKNDVIFLFTDGEEVGLLGAQAFVEQHPWAKEVGLALNLDTGRDTGTVYTYETSPGKARLISEYAKVVPYPATSSMMSEVYSSMPNESDFTPFKKAGIQGFNFAHVGGKFRYHTITDNQANLDRGSIQHMGSYAISLTRHFGNLDLSNLRQDNDSIYFNIFNLALIIYPEEWALPFAIFAALIFIGLVILGWWLKKVRLIGLFLGALAFLLDIVMSASIVWLIWQGLVKIYPHYGAVVDIHNGFFYWLASITLTIAITAAFYNFLRRHFRLAELSLGALLWWLIATVMVSVLMPGMSYWLEWPLLFSLIGLGLLELLPETESSSWRKAVLLVVSALPALLIFSWSIYARYINFGTDLLIVQALTVALMLGLLIPHLDLFVRFNWKMNFNQILHASSEILFGSLVGDFDVPPACQGLQKHEQVASTFPSILKIITSWYSIPHWQRQPGFAHHLIGHLVKTDHWYLSDPFGSMLPIQPFRPCSNPLRISSPSPFPSRLLANFNYQNFFDEELVPDHVQTMFAQSPIPDR